MRIVGRKNFMLSCIFFILVMLVLGKSIKILNINNSINMTAVPIDSTIDKQAASSKYTPLKKYYIVIDPGHGGIDKGTSYGNMYEKDLTLKIARYAAAYLKGKGNVVFLTRNEDKLLGLDEIGDKVNSSYADAFVSIHVNSLNDNNFNGITTLYYDVNGYQKDERIKLARAIESEAVKNDNWANKGIKRQNLAVLRYSKVPGVLVECGFITNAQDRIRLSNENVLKRLGENISNGIIYYLNENYKK
ncbi:N-acetylmuramoyl-L-alanine amidase family protein [Clostridium luticellarii]|jgi:N-acetylmuramoyl-L-alanine amidase|uniref:N-acetylmuramoyl-L-alanine amidase LytC n=1 Tax=Clostridium luticellarii TaxID=1691940 RepID=A0A2T0BLP4_9CLOT|nr:N-acetylmuramoyl-L-alanine amidase [Clostridium luticellarii]MCI1945408.1 N-acetylmuramoyl-L-alanine amidase [Clostridium luticellarii]MCI1968743.1 N-acetylmuramoyl-L-alanine amidase [Clostridium luticellarii]MCI1994902.1 N-acetylmuramoyl-L-alanine amidase [Clostridium luticellarii]MCI2040169.1 N-acetylmuramoyl-L-alanine amidase [Clostridium luticellarii]PRR84702.1 N-acetylmuramoyl-L-alanine amidase LytC precursor [Clostridium luticellarii]